MYRVPELTTKANLLRVFQPSLCHFSRQLAAPGTLIKHSEEMPYHVPEIKDGKWLSFVPQRLGIKAC